MAINSFLEAGINKIMNIGGLSITVNILSYTFSSGSYDDDVVKTLTGSFITSGLLFPIKSKFGSEESLLLEQGKILTKDKVLYTGSVNISGNQIIDIKGDKYTIIPDGIQSWDCAGSTIYNKMFLRHTITGSLY